MTKGEETRQFIIEKAAPIFNIKGIAATTMSDIMEATKLSKGSLYVHFDNKDVLANAVVDYNMQKLGAKVMSEINKHTSAKDKLHAYLDVFADPLRPPVTGGCPMLNFGMEADDTNPVIKEKVHKTVEHSQQVLIDLVQKGIAEGAFNPDWNYREFATVAFALIEGGNLICYAAGNSSKMKVIMTALRRLIAEQTL